MDLLAVLLHLSAIHILMAMVPGPNTVVVSYCAAAISRQAGLTAASGVAVASLAWVSLSLLGISALLVHAGDLFRLIRLAGAAYLIYVGIRLLQSRGRSETAEAVPIYRSPFRGALTTTLSNPKSAIFWTSVFAVVLPAHAPAWFYGTVLVLITLQSFLWYGTVAMVLSSPFSRKHYARVATALNRLAGTCMLFFGMKIANDVRAEIAASSV